MTFQPKDQLPLHMAAARPTANALPIVQILLKTSAQQGRPEDRYTEDSVRASLICLWISLHTMTSSRMVAMPCYLHAKADPYRWRRSCFRFTEKNKPGYGERCGNTASLFRNSPWNRVLFRTRVTRHCILHASERITKWRSCFWRTAPKSMCKM